MVEKGDDNVKVIVRCRPLNSTEKSNGNKSIVTCDEQHGQVKIERSGDQPKGMELNFD